MDYKAILHTLKDITNNASDEDIKAALDLLGIKEPTPVSVEETETIELTPSKEELSMPTTNKSALTSVMSPAPIPQPEPTPEGSKEYRDKLFEVYPEIGSLYNDIATTPNTTLSTWWFNSASMGKKMAQFVTFIEFLDVTEIFPNFSQIKEAASLTDGGTVSLETLKLQKLICDKAFEYKKEENEAKRAKVYRDIAQAIYKAEPEKKELDELLLHTIKFCGLDADLTNDMFKAEVEFNLIFK